jgi:hypothetical protein
MDPRLDRLIERALDLWPDLIYTGDTAAFPSRAHAAAQFISDGDVYPTGPLPASGDDGWMVHGKRCSFEGRFCDCRDSLAPRDIKLGKLCKHRLAIIFTLKLQREDHTAALEQIFAGAGHQVTLKVRTLYAYDGARRTTCRLAGSRLDEGNWRTLDAYEDELPFRIDDLDYVLARLGWSAVPGVKVNRGRHAGGHEIWAFEKLPVTAPALTRVQALYGLDAATAELRQTNQRIDHQFAASLNT